MKLGFIGLGNMGRAICSGLIHSGAIAAQKLTFNGCTFTDYTNMTKPNSSNPTWIRPAYGNWNKGDNEGQGEGFKSLTKINFTGNTVTSTRPVKFERIAQWEMDTKVTATNNNFNITAQTGDDSNMLPWLLLLLASGGAAAALVSRKRSCGR